MNIGITGQSGFIGRHLYNYLNLNKELKLIDFERECFSNPSKLDTFVSSCDVIVHLAALNRHEDQNVIFNENVRLVEQIILSCETTNSTPHILFSSSTQEDRNNLYGQSKKQGRLLLETWAKKNNAKTTGIVIPNVFGPFGKPNYNSVVATFCHKLVNNEMPEIHIDGNLKLIYVNKLVEEISTLISNGTEGKVSIPHQYELKVSELLENLQEIKNQYLIGGEFPSLMSPLKLDLFNTFRCYVPTFYYPKSFVEHKDDRGAFVEIVRANTTGQFSFSTTKPGITRGNHFHTRKAERFAVIKGKARIDLRKIDSDEIISYQLSGDKPSYVDMPIWYTHNITNVGDEELLTLFWINEPYDPEDPDTYFINV